MRDDVRSYLNRLTEEYRSQKTDFSTLSGRISQCTAAAAARQTTVIRDLLDEIDLVMTGIMDRGFVIARAEDELCAILGTDPGRLYRVLAETGDPAPEIPASLRQDLLSVAREISDAWEKLIGTLESARHGLEKDAGELAALSRFGTGEKLVAAILARAD